MRLSSDVGTLPGMRRFLLPLVLTLVIPAQAADASYAGSVDRKPSAAAHAEARKPMPKLKIKTVVRHLDHPWDVKSLPGGVLIFTQRDRATLSVFKNGKVHRVGFPKSSVWVSGETGLMGLEVDPDFATNRRIYTCQGGFTGGGHDVHVTAWTLDSRLHKATMDKVLVGGFPTSSGRHGGCRLRRDQ